MSLTLYHAVPSRSAIVRWMLEEIGAPYEVRLIDFKSGENRQPEYLKINPMGKVPALEHDGVVITEAAAICCYLADAFPEARLNVPVNDRRRGPYLKWLFFGPSCVEPATVEVMLKREPGPRGQVGWGDQESVLKVLAEALHEGPWLLGDHFSAADVVIGSGLRWGMMTKAIPEKPEFISYVKRLAERPALARAMQKDAEVMNAR
ncbi:MAG: glutathione S-transferase family protein [Lysobacterales bacterium]|nr:MAG: glutathione S-transferase family protein [Xanthomonadales bacterium]